MALPRSLAWLFPEHRSSDLDPDRDARLVLARVLERGRMEDVRWCVRYYGLDTIHDFFRNGHPEISERTIELWQSALDARSEEWPRPRRSRLGNAAPWPG